MGSPAAEPAADVVSPPGAGLGSPPGPQVSVVLTSRYEPARLEHSLGSLLRQRLPYDRFEVVVVRHGPQDGSAVAVGRAMSAAPGVDCRLLPAGSATRGAARNAGLQACRAPWVTFVQDEDAVSDGYLAGLLSVCGQAMVVQALEAELSPAGHPPDFRAPDAREILAHQGRVLGAQDVPRVWTSLTGKLVPSAWAAAIGFEEFDLGEDSCFLWQQLLAGDPTLVVTPVTTGAVYYRAVPQPTPAAIGAGDKLLDGLGRLLSLPAPPRLSAVRAALIEVETRRLNRCLRADPDAHRAVIARRRRDRLDEVDLTALNEGVARDLAILYNAVPFVDTSANVAARRVREREVLVDVVCSDLSRDVRTDRSSSQVWEEFVGQQFMTRTDPSVVWWTGVDDYCRQGLARIKDWERAKGPYRSVYSRSMYPASHALAALYKIIRPAAHWIAEFSDPYSLDVLGRRRVSTGRADPVHRAMLRAALHTRGFPVPDDDNMLPLVESVVYALADRIVFTNRSQLEYMLEHTEVALHRLVRAKAEISPHPSLPADFYRRVRTTYPTSPTRLNLGYFGAFYATRGIEEIVEALRLLSEQERELVLLHVFTGKPADVAGWLGGLEASVSVQPYVDFLEYLNLTTRFDVLIIKDAQTEGSHSRNPYLPSKWSDFLGSGRPVWGLIEQGSELSAKPLAFRSAIGDAVQARDVIRAALRQWQDGRAESAQNREVMSGSAPGVGSSVAPA